MARARNIKPGLFKNEVLVEMPVFCRLLFIGLWTLADREGRLEDRPKRIKLELFPYDSDDTEAALKKLTGSKFIERYEESGFNVIQIVNFLKHQSPHGTEKDSVLPDSDGFLTVHERNKSGCVTGNKQLINVRNGEINVNPPLDNSGLTVGERPDSPNHESKPTIKNYLSTREADENGSQLPEMVNIDGLWYETKNGELTDDQKRAVIARNPKGRPAYGEGDENPANPPPNRFAGYSVAVGEVEIAEVVP